VKSAEEFLQQQLRHLLHAPRVFSEVLATTGTAALARGVLAMSSEVRSESNIYGLRGDLNQALACAAVMPVLAVLSASKASESDMRQRLFSVLERHGDYVSSLFEIITRRPASPAERRVLEALLVSWHGGFGVVTPTILALRVIAGTGATAIEALAGGILAAGPRHVGASAHALTFMLKLIDNAAQSGEDALALDQTIAAALDEHGLLHGMGHPLLDPDPRPVRLRELAHGLGARPALRLYDGLCAKLEAERELRPNIDMMTAAILATFGVTEPEIAVGVALGSRSFAMLAHIQERRHKPAFGVKKSVAREAFKQLNVDWL
jgi:citrate synthase